MSSITPLLSSPGRELLAQWEREGAFRSLSPMDLALAIRSQVADPEVASAVASQLQLRTQAEKKFGSLARTLLWTRDGYEQATPARRTGKQGGSKRITSPEDWSPSLDQVLAWGDSIPRLGVKVAPGIPYDLIPEHFHAQWTSVDGDLLEAALWAPELAPEGAGRSASVITADQVHTLIDPQTLDSYIFEPDSAVIRSGTIACLAEQMGAHLVSESIAYLSGPTLHQTPFASAFEVIDHVNLRVKNIQQVLRALNVGRVEIKKRGADIQPDALRKSLKLKGDAEAVIIATRIRGAHRAIIARRISDGEA